MITMRGSEGEGVKNEWSQFYEVYQWLQLASILMNYLEPVEVTHPNNLMTWGWGRSVFIISSSDNRSFLSLTGAFPDQEKKKNHTLPNSMYFSHKYSKLHFMREKEEWHVFGNSSSFFANISNAKLPNTCKTDHDRQNEIPQQHYLLINMLT